MTETTQSQIDKTSEKDNEFISEFANSKKLHKGVTVNNPTVSVETILVPKYRRQIFESLSSNDEEKEKLIQEDFERIELVTNEVTKEDILNTIQKVEEEELLDEGFSDDFNLINRQDLVDIGYQDTIDIIPKNEDMQLITCSIKNIVRIQYNNAMDETQSIFKEFCTKNEAEEFAKKIETEKIEIIYDDGLKIKGFDGNFTESLSSAVRENSYPMREFMIALAICSAGVGFGIFTWVFSGTLFPLALLTFGSIIIMSMAIQNDLYEIYDDFRDEYGLTSYAVNKRSYGIKVDDLINNIQKEKEITVRADKKEDSLVIRTDDINTKWVFEMEDGTMPIEAIEFIESNCVELLMEDKVAKMTACRFKEPDVESIESFDGEWYLYSRF